MKRVKLPWEGHLKRHQPLNWKAQPYETPEGVYQPTGSVMFENAGTYSIDWTPRTGLTVRQVKP